jgi:hypothetical protein
MFARAEDAAQRMRHGQESKEDLGALKPAYLTAISAGGGVDV